MGQYYHPAILGKDKKTVLKWFLSHTYGNFCGLKLMEHSYMKNKFVGAVESTLVGNPQHIVWAGDYAEKDKGLKTNVHERCTDKKEVSPNDVPPIIVKAKYIVNHTKKEFIDKSKVPSFDGGWKIHPLPLMVCCGNGLGGGDFRGEDPNNIVGSWARDLISVENTKPKGFKEIIFNLTDGAVDPPKGKKQKEFEVEVTRYYVVTDHIKVTATNEEEAKEKAETESDNKDYRGNLELDHVTTEII